MWTILLADWRYSAGRKQGRLRYSSSARGAGPSRWFGPQLGGDDGPTKFSRVASLAVRCPRSDPMYPVGYGKGLS